MVTPDSTAPVERLPATNFRHVERTLQYEVRPFGGGPASSIPIHLYAILMRESAFVWLGAQHQQDMSSLAMAMALGGANVAGGTTRETTTTLLAAPATPNSMLLHTAASAADPTHCTLSNTEESLARKLTRRFGVANAGVRAAMDAGTSMVHLPLKQVFVSCGHMADGTPLDADDRRMVCFS